MNKNLKDIFISALIAVFFFSISSHYLMHYTFVAIRCLFIACGIFGVFAFIHCLNIEIKIRLRLMHIQDNLLFKYEFKKSIVNTITLYRIIICPVLLLLLFDHSPEFKWLLLSAFITDILDGFLARKLNVVTKSGAKLDSIADDLLFVVSLIAILYLHSEIFIQYAFSIAVLLFIFSIKMIILWMKHRKIISGMHTYLTKAAAFFQALFFLACVFSIAGDVFFKISVIITFLALMEEITIIYASNELKENTKGLFFKQ